MKKIKLPLDWYKGSLRSELRSELRAGAMIRDSDVSTGCVQDEDWTLEILDDPSLSHYIVGIEGSGLGYDEFVLVDADGDEHQPIPVRLGVTLAARLAGVTRTYIKAEIAAGRLGAQQIATGAANGPYVIWGEDFSRWLDNPRRGSRSK